MLTLSDCRRRIQLEFFLGTPRARRESLRKIDLLIKQLEQFRTGLQTEAGLIEQYEAKQRLRLESQTKPQRREQFQMDEQTREAHRRIFETSLVAFPTPIAEKARAEFPGSADCYRLKDDPGHYLLIAFAPPGSLRQS